MRQCGLLAAASTRCSTTCAAADDHALLRQLARQAGEVGATLVLPAHQPWPRHTNILFTDVHADVAPAFTAWLASMVCA